MRLLSRPAAAEDSGSGTALVLLTGATMRRAARQLLGLRVAAFRPQHSHKLGAFCRATRTQQLVFKAASWLLPIYVLPCSACSVVGH